MNTPKLQRRGIIAAALAFLARTQHAGAIERFSLPLDSECVMGAQCQSARCRGGMCVEGIGSCRINARCKHNYQCCSNRCIKRRRKFGDRKGVRYCKRVRLSD